MHGAGTDDIAPLDIKVERVRQELTQAQLAERAGVDQSTVSLVENGKAWPAAIQAVLKALWPPDEDDEEAAS